jgi:hypothetical protein
VGMSAQHIGELRDMVREVLREVMAGRSQGKGAAAAGRTEKVRIASAADLALFVKQILALSADPQAAEALRTGKLRFVLLEPASTAATANHGSGTVLDGVITEQKIERLAGSGRVLLGPGAVVTPLARDRARRLGLKLERKL